METRDRADRAGAATPCWSPAASTRRASSTSCSAKTGLKGKCAIVTSYEPHAGDIKGEETRRGRDREAAAVRHLPADAGRLVQRAGGEAMNKVEEFEKEVKKKFIEEPGQMKLLIVVDKLLTGFDAPPATYLYIDKQMRDHGLFQAICRVNRLDGDDKDYGYIVDYKDLFKCLESAITRLHQRRARRLRQGGRRGAAGGPAREGARATGGGAGGDPGALRAGRAAQGHAGSTCTTSAPRSRATPSSSRPTSRSASTLYKLSRRSSAPTPTSPTRWPTPATRDAEIAAIKDEVEHYEKVRDEVKLAQRRLHRPQACTSRHAAPDRHLHPGRRQREGLRLRRPGADPAHRRARGGCASTRCPRASGRTKKPSPRPSRTTSAS